MRAIGYPRLISMEGFRTPNFGQVAQILTWLLERYDHTSDIGGSAAGLATEEERVAFLKLAAQTMLAKARVRLNTRHLYSADVHAVRELLKLAQLLYDATAMQEGKMPASLAAAAAAVASQQTVPPGWNAAQDVRAVRQTAAELTASAATVHGLVDGEVAMQDQRTRAMRELDNEQLEKAVHSQTRAVAEDAQALGEQLESLTQDEASLKAKIERKRQELERMLTRLRGLRGLRPAFMDEYERLEQELQQLYTAYLERFRNLDYLESELDALSRREATKDQRRKHILSVYSEVAQSAEAHELRAAAGDIDEIDEDDEDDAGQPPLRSREVGDDDEEGEEEPPRRRRGRQTPGPQGRRRVRMQGLDDDDDDEGEDNAPQQQKGPVRRVQGSMDGPAGESDDSISPVVSEDDEEDAALDPRGHW